jgi:hypothetical protein
MGSMVYIANRQLQIAHCKLKENQQFVLNGIVEMPYRKYQALREKFEICDNRFAIQISMPRLGC